MSEKFLPIQTILPELQETLEQHGTVIVQAPPGAGKSTLLPIFLLEQATALGGALGGGTNGAAFGRKSRAAGWLCGAL
jgi:HrpA-like RNA helicase